PRRTSPAARRRSRRCSSTSASRSTSRSGTTGRRRRWRGGERPGAPARPRPARTMTVEVLNRIGDELRPASDGAVVERRNPADHRQVVSVAPESTAEDVRDAVSAAVAAQPAWAATPPSARAAVLERAADILAGRAEEIARELTAEEGKPLADARAEASRTPTNPGSTPVRRSA